MKPTKAVTLPAFCLLFLLFSLLPTCSSSSATLSISSSNNIVCAITSSTSPQNIVCTNFSANPPYTIQVLPNISFLSLSGGRSTFCSLRPDSLSFLCWPTSTFTAKRVHIGSQHLSDLSLGSTHISALTNTSVDFWRTDSTFNRTVPGSFKSLTSGNDYSCAINNINNKTECWGKNGARIQNFFWNETMLNIVGGENNACGENSSGVLMCSNSITLGNNRYEYSDWALGSNHVCAVKKANGTVVCRGGEQTGGEYTPIGDASVEFLVAGGKLTCGVLTGNFSVVCWVANPNNLSIRVLPFPKILPGVCIKEEDKDKVCSCGIVPDSQSLCVNSGVICRNSCPNVVLPPPSSPPPPSPPPPPPPPYVVTKKKTSKLWLIFAIIGGAGTLIGVCSIVYCIWNCFCRQNKIFNSVQPTVAVTNGNNVSNVVSRSSSGVVPSPRVSPSTSKSNIFRRQISRAIMRRQRSGPSSFKERGEQFTFSDLAAATNNFSLEFKIGAGSFGTVYSAKLPDGREVAIKRSEPSLKSRKVQEKESAFQSELSFLSRVHHKHLVGLVGYCNENEERLLVYDFMKNGSLYDHLHTKKQENSPLLKSWKIRIKVLLDASRGIEYLHNYAVPPIIHRDIKSSNILLDSNWVARVSDFGLSLLEPTNKDEYLSMKTAGTVGYMDPEYYGLHRLTVKTDVYGFGVVILEVLTGKRAIFKGVDPEGDGSPVSVVDFAIPDILKGELFRVLDGRVGVPGSNEAEAVELVAYTAVHCVSLEGNERPSMTDIVSNLENALALCEDSHGSMSSASVSLSSYD